MLGLVAGVGPAWATITEPPPGMGTPLQTATQSNEATNEANQTANSNPTVISGTNTAGGGLPAPTLIGASSCNSCGGGSGDVDQNSGNVVKSSADNSADQSNNQSNGAGQSQTAGSGASKDGGAEQSADQSNEGHNEANQTANSNPIVVSGPNIAMFNDGDVHQNSGNKVDSSASNDANQQNNQENGAGQSQTTGQGGSCCKSSSSADQSANQSNDGSNYANQSAKSEPVVISGGNIAVFNHGDVNQNSGNYVRSSADNDADQQNNQENGAGQSQTTGHGDWCCSKESGGASQSADQSNKGKNKANQTANSNPVVVSGNNIAMFNHGDVNQNSGNWVDSSARNDADQTNTQSNGLGQSQSVKGGGKGCCYKDGSDAEQSAHQSNYGKNEADQWANSNPTVISGDNSAFGGSDGYMTSGKCERCGSPSHGGDVNQNSGNWVKSSASNDADQTNTQSNGLGQSQWVKGGPGCCRKDGGGATQTAEQSNKGKNEANQTANSNPTVISGDNTAGSGGLKEAFGPSSKCERCGSPSHGGDVNQNSGNWVKSSASNDADQTNTQSNGLGQSQWVKGGSGCCGKDGGATQTADQSNYGKNEADQWANSNPTVISGGNTAFGGSDGYMTSGKCERCGSPSHGGDVNQNSGNWVKSSASNDADQTNTQSNGLGQSQWVKGGSGCCGKDGGGATQTADQSNYGKNKANQTANSNPTVISGDNTAGGSPVYSTFGPVGGGRGGGCVNQNSGNWVDSSASNDAA